jgi:integrative and conjugative element protein (TIGR02256 family)
MDIGFFLSLFGDPVAQEKLESADARALVSFVERYAQHVASVVEVRCREGWELVVLDFQTGRPQRSTYDVKRCERIGVRFNIHGEMPRVYMLRADFPDTDHQQLTIECEPRVICIDDRPWAEARLTWTPAELVQRVLAWFSRAIRGELHDARQPVDPVLSGSPLSFLISRRTLEDAASKDLVGVHNTDHQKTLRVMPLQDFTGSPENVDPVCAVAYCVSPEKMTRMQFAPTSLGSLAAILEERGIDLIKDLRDKLSGWLNESEAWRLQARFVVIVEMPIISPRHEQQPGTDLRAYMTEQSAGDIAVSLGIAIPDVPGSTGTVGFVRSVGIIEADQEAVNKITVQIAEIHYEFDQLLATQLTGRKAVDDRTVVMVGAGAIGSHVAGCLVREGRFSWTVIDDDILLPHNIGRHTGRNNDVTNNKANLVATSLNNVLNDCANNARPIPANLFAEEPLRIEIDAALNGADIIIDATASVLAERHLSDHSSSARRVSIFFTPSGDGAVLLVEPADRSCTLRDLEAQYLGLVTHEERLTGHLVSPEDTFVYTGACRAVTNIIPESRIMVLSGLIAGGLTNAIDVPEGVIQVWSMGEEGNVDTHIFSPSHVSRQEVAGWEVTVDAGVVEGIMAKRADCLPNETGGILFGVVDIPGKRIHIVHGGSAPPDSEQTSTGFVRGTAGVQEHIDRTFEETRGQVRYVGEWHSHPPRVAPVPSRTDLLQIDWLAALFDMDTLPALMLIAGDHSYSIILANMVADNADAPEIAGYSP